MAQLIAAALVAAAAVGGDGRGACLRPEPTQVVLVGRLVPDRRYLALKLDRPVCVLAGAGQPAAEGVRLVRFSFQMLRTAPSVEGWEGRRAAASGSLFRGPHDRDGELTLLVTGFGRAR